jgi:hypothetical protein
MIGRILLGAVLTCVLGVAVLLLSLWLERQGKRLAAWIGEDKGRDSFVLGIITAIVVAIGVVMVSISTWELGGVAIGLLNGPDGGQ